MSPAVTAVAATQDGEPAPTCMKCLGALSDVALRCKGCQAHVHLRCSDLADYQLIRFSVTQAAFSCANCVKKKDTTEDQYEVELAKIKEILAKEESIIEQTEKDADTSTLGTGDGVQDNVDNTIITQQNTTSEPGDRNKKKPICRYFKTKSCRHGAKGTNCNFRHPPKCMKFLKHGDKSGRECRKGTNCDRYHPRLCFNSQNKGWCDDVKCNFHHLPGTKWSPPQQTPEDLQNQPSYASTARRRPGAEVRNVEPRQGHRNPPQNQNQSQDTGLYGNGSQAQPNFQELILQIQQMPLQLVKLLQSEGTHLGPRARSRGCSHCCESPQ